MPFVLNGGGGSLSVYTVDHYVFLNDWTQLRSPLFKWMSLAIFFWNGFYVRRITLTLKGQSCWDPSKRYSISLIFPPRTQIYIYICIVYTGSRKKNAEFPECSSTSLELRLENLVTYKNMKETRHLENEFQVTVSHSRRFWWRGERIGKGRGRIVGESVARGHIR